MENEEMEWKRVGRIVMRRGHTEYFQVGVQCAYRTY